MGEMLLANEVLIRLLVFAGGFALIAFWEAALPRRERGYTRRERWPANLGVVVLNTLVLRVFFPTAAVGVALLVEAQGGGLLGFLALPYWLAVALSVALLDFAIYLQHVMFHAMPVLWRLHRMHHADRDFDVTTGARFHPIEILLSMLIKLAVVLALGPPAIAVLIFEVLLNLTAMFNHGNIRLPLALDAGLRWLLVTPDMHRVHHSQEIDEANSNFGFNLPWWDRLMGTYRAQPRAGHMEMEIGLARLAEPVLCHRLLGLLSIPFRKGLTDYSLPRRERS